MIKNRKKPVSVEIAPVFYAGKKGKRLMVTLYAQGCGYGKCNFCAFKELTTKGDPLKEVELIEQFTSAISGQNFDKKNIIKLDIYNSGSFLNPSEIPLKAQTEILQRASLIKDLECVMIESRPEHIIANPDRLLNFKEILGEKELEVAVGLETSDDFIRNVIMNKGFKLSDFRDAAEIISDCACNLLVYVFLKPPFLDEKNAIEDSIKTIIYLSELAMDLELSLKIALQPAFVGINTPLEELFLKGLYKPPTLWNVIEILYFCSDLVDIQVALNDEGLSNGRFASTCPKCNKAVRLAVEKFNQDGSLNHFNNLLCNCEKEGI